MRLIAVCVAAVLVTGCAVPGLTSGTDVPLSLKGYSPGQALASCPTGPDTMEQRSGDTLYCVLPNTTIAGKETVLFGLAIYKGAIVSIMADLSQAAGYSQPAVLRALTDRYGPPARAAGRVTMHLWTNDGNQMTLDQIKGELRITNLRGMFAMQTDQAKLDSDDL